MNNPFLDACGATGPLALDVESAGATGVETRAFDLPFVLIGRDPRSDLRLDHRDVSDRHGYLQVVDGQLLCIDLGSRLGIMQNGKCQRLAFLDRDRPVRVGPYRVRLVGGDRDPTALDRFETPGSPLPLELNHRSVRRSRCDLPGGLALVGSAPDCQIRLVDPSVSNYHCSLVHTPAGVWVVDLLSQGGVRVNGQEVAYAQVFEGDTLHVGHSEIRLLERTDAISPAESVIPAAPPASTVDPASSNSRPPETLESAARSAELVERVLNPMVNQFGALQQQIADEFQQARALMVESLSAQLQEHSAFINQELEQLRQVSEEIHALRADIDRQARLLDDRISATESPSSSRLGAASHTLPALIPSSNGYHPNTNTRPSGFIRPATESAIIRGQNDQAHAKLCARITRLQSKQASPWARFRAIFATPFPRKSTT